MEERWRIVVSVPRTTLSLFSFSLYAFPNAMEIIKKLLFFGRGILGCLFFRWEWDVIGWWFFFLFFCFLFRGFLCICSPLTTEERSRKNVQDFCARASVMLVQYALGTITDVKRDGMIEFAKINCAYIYAKRDCVRVYYRTNTHGEMRWSKVCFLRDQWLVKWCFLKGKVGGRKGEERDFNFFSQVLRKIKRTWYLFLQEKRDANRLEL